MTAGVEKRGVADGGMPSATVAVWDPFVRVFHWSLAAGFALAWITADEWDQVHEWAGYAAGALVGLRLVWGLIGPRYARFAQFVRGPRATLGYLRDLLAGTEQRHLGHNPAGAVMIVALMTGVGALVLTGWMMTLNAFWGAEWVEEVHEIVANLMLLLVGLHVAGVILESVRHGENLVKAMITGRKRWG